MSDDYTDNNAALAALYPAHIQALLERHDHALSEAGASHALIFSGRPKYAFLDDRNYPFQANPHFLSWLPLTQVPLSYIIYTAGERPILIYYQPHDYWHSVPGAPSGYWAGHFDIRVVHTTDEIAKHLPAELDKCILIGEIDDEADACGIDRINPTTALNILHWARGCKTDYEIACMRLASERAVKGHIAAETAFRNGLSEFDIHRAYCEAVSHTDFELPYQNIVALNEHGAILHYTDLERTAPAEPRSFLIDAGAAVHGYAADITRTYSRGDADFQNLIERMDNMQQRLVAQVKAGIDYRALHISTHRLLAKLLVDAELAVGSEDALLETGVTSAFFPHGLGHLLGIQVHDVGGFLDSESGNTIDAPAGHPYLRLTRVLQENMVLTIEPGLYVIDMLLDALRGSPAEQHINWSRVEWLRPFGGIRIEDDVRVLADGCENLTRDAFRQA